MGTGAADGSAISREMAERILRRATELSPDVTDGPTGPGTWADPTLTEQVLVEAAAEVGIEPAAVHRAIALERLGPPPPVRFADRFVGPSTVAADVETSWSPDDTLRLIDSWLVQAHHLRRERTKADGGQWRRRRDISAKIQRTLRGLNGEGRLGDSDLITATAVAVGATHTVARLEVDRSTKRAGSATAGGVVTALGVTGVAVLAVMTSPILLVATPLAGFVGVAVARSGRSSAQEAEREAVRMLDAVQRGEWPRRVTDDVREAFRTRRTP